MRQRAKCRQRNFEGENILAKTTARQCTIMGGEAAPFLASADFGKLQNVRGTAFL
jgi:hypothetical protein